MSKCIDPRAISEGDLLAYLHGDASPDVNAHIVRCPSCAREADELRIVDAQLVAAFYRENCPSADVLAGFVLHRLPAAERLRVAAHVRDCADCSDEVASVRDVTDEEPPTLLARLRLHLSQALVARPVVSAAAPARGAGWQGRFEVDDVLITLSTQQGTLSGRVRRRGEPEADCSGRAWLLTGGAEPERSVPQSKVDASGRFHFTAQVSGSITLLLQTGGQDIALEDVWVE